MTRFSRIEIVRPFCHIRYVDGLFYSPQSLYQRSSVEFMCLFVRHVLSRFILSVGVNGPAIRADTQMVRSGS